MCYPASWEKTFTAKNGETIQFRPKQAADTEMLWVMFSTLSEATVSNLIPPFTRERVEGWTKDIDYSKVLAIVAVTANGRIVANASLQFNPQEVLRHKAELGITVHDSCQNLGVGTALIEHLLEIAKEKGIKKVHLTVRADNKRAIHLYNKFGFKVEGTFQKEMLLNGEYIDDQRMALFL
jgi:ribosomal protein S18 acetylase RimI-like enzyme